MLTTSKNTGPSPVMYEISDARNAPTLLNRNKLSMVRRRARHSRQTPLIIGPPRSTPTMRHTQRGMLCKIRRCSRSTSDRLTASATVILLKARNAPIAIRHHTPLPDGEAELVPQQPDVSVVEAVLMAWLVSAPPALSPKEEAFLMQLQVPATSKAVPAHPSVSEWPSLGLDPLEGRYLSRLGEHRSTPRQSGHR